MNRSVRKVALALALAFVALTVQIGYDQVVASQRFAEHPANRRLLVKEYSSQRGDIIASGTVLAQSLATDDRLKYIRNYPLGALTAEITGYYSLVYGGASLERSFNAFLAGKKPPQVRSIVDDLLGRDTKGHSLILTLDLELQRIAATMMGKQRGAVAAIDPATGAILALYSSPTYNPAPLSSHDTKQIRKAWAAYNDDPLTPMVARSYQERYPPGSTFKVVVSAAALEAGVKPNDTFPNPRTLPLPLSNRTLGNFGGGSCRAGSRISFATALRVSCNTTFAQIGDRIGAGKLEQMTDRFGFDSAPEFDLAAIPSCLRAARRGCSDEALDRPQTMLSSIGQFDVRVTPLQMALVAATVQNLGIVPRPHLVKQIQDFSGEILEERVFGGSEPIYSRQTATTLRQMMIDVVRTGTGRSAAIKGVEVGGKTGTAETGAPGKSPHAWFISFAPGIAVAVVVENGGSLGDEATGGKVAAPIAKALMQKVVERSRSAKP